MTVMDVPRLVARKCRDAVVGVSPPWVQARMAVYGGDLRAAANIALGAPGPVLRDRGLDILVDHAPATRPVPVDLPEVVPVVAVHRIEVGGLGVFDCGEDATLVDAGLEADVELPHSCTLGGCGTCRVRLVAGQVDMETDEGLSAEELEAGDILACVARPRSDIVLRYEEDCS